MEYAKQFCPPNKAAKAVGRNQAPRLQTGWEIPMESALAVERENQQILSRVKMRRKVWLRTWRRGGGFQGEIVPGARLVSSAAGENAARQPAGPSALRRRRYDLTRKEECLLRK